MSNAVVGYAPACPDCGAVGRPMSEPLARRLADQHNEHEGHDATVKPIRETDRGKSEQVVLDA